MIAYCIFIIDVASAIVQCQFMETEHRTRIEIMEKMTATAQTNGLWKVSYDGVILGDDRAFATEELANQEIQKRLVKDARDAVTYNRPLLYTA
jgi:hypothetical protein